MLLARYAAEQRLPGVGGAHAAPLLVAVERHRVSADLLAPETILEASLQRLRLLQPSPFEGAVAENGRQLRGAIPGCIGIALHLAERDRRIGEPAVGVKDRIRGVLPALVDETAHRFAAILDESLVVDVAVSLHPQHRGPDVGPQP